MSDEKKGPREEARMPFGGGRASGTVHEGMINEMMGRCAAMMPRMKAKCCGADNEEEEPPGGEDPEG